MDHGTRPPAFQYPAYPRGNPLLIRVVDAGFAIAAGNQDFIILLATGVHIVKKSAAIDDGAGLLHVFYKNPVAYTCGYFLPLFT